MAKSRNNISSLLARLSSKSVNSINISKFLEPISLADQLQSRMRTGSIPSSGDTNMLSIGGKTAPTGIQFGRPSKTSTTSTQSSSVMSDLLKQTAAGGLASFLGGGLGSVAGLGGLVSGLVHLFGGGNSAPPPLVQFQLPDSQERTVYLSSKGSTVYQGTSVEQASLPNAGGTGSTNISGQKLQYQSTQIADAVKKALLNSSSLNDVIAEI